MSESRASWKARLAKEAAGRCESTATRYDMLAQTGHPLYRENWRRRAAACRDEALRWIAVAEYCLSPAPADRR